MVKSLSNTKRDPESGSISINSWISHLEKLYPNKQVEIIKKTLEIIKLNSNSNSDIASGAINQNNHNQTNIETAVLLSEIHADPTAILAALFFNITDFSDINYLEKNTIQTISSILTGFHKLNQWSSSSPNSNLPDNKLDNKLDKSNSINIEYKSQMLRKMLLSLVSDVRIVLIYLAHQLIALKNIKNKKNINQQIIFAKNILMLDASLANRLGIGQIKWELEDRAFAIINPEKYSHITKMLNEKRADRELRLEKAKLNLIKELDKAKIKADFQGRVKHIYSISRKMGIKTLDFKELYDIQALRVLVQDVSMCYRVLGILNQLWEPIISEFDDYIANPKSNGYQSLHAVLEFEPKQYIEVQIRTFKMHESSEMGMAAHWQYKEGKKSGLSDHQRVKWLRGLLDWQKEVSIDLGEQGLINLEKKIYVFTPNGDLFELSHGASVLDFAYHIHTDIGHRFRGAKVNGNIVPINYILNTGDAVEILTNKNSKPSRDWLDPTNKIANTSRARSKISNYFRKHDYDSYIKHGKDKLSTELSAAQIKAINFENILPKFNVKTESDLFAAIGMNKVKLNTLLNAIKNLSDNKNNNLSNNLSNNLNSDPNNDLNRDLEFLSKSGFKNIEKISGLSSSYKGFIIEDIDQVMSHTAKCCQPVLGDEIIGYVTQGTGISIHRTQCQHISKMQKKNPERIMRVQWGDGFNKPLPAQLKIFLSDIQANQRQEFIKNMTAVLFNEKCMLSKMNSYYANKDKLFVIELTILVSNHEFLNLMLIKIKSLKSVIDVIRVHG